MSDFRTPLARILGLGSAKMGTEEFWLQRVTAVAMVFLTIYFVILVICLQGQPYEDVVSALRHPINAVLMVCFVIAGVYHGKIGIQVVLEDYAQNAATRVILLLANNFFCALVALGCIFAVLKIAFGG